MIPILDILDVQARTSPNISCLIDSPSLPCGLNYGENVVSVSNPAPPNQPKLALARSFAFTFSRYASRMHLAPALSRALLPSALPPKDMGLLALQFLVDVKKVLESLAECAGRFGQWCKSADSDGFSRAPR